MVKHSELEAGYKTVLEIFENRPVKRVLVDTSKRDLGPMDTPQQIFKAILVKALPNFNNLLFVALVAPPEEYYYQAEEYSFDRMTDIDNQFMILQRFQKIQETEAWLETVG